MRDSDVLDNNPHVSRSALEAIHGQVFGWALSRCDYEQAVAEDLVQQAYVELLTGKARFDGASSLNCIRSSIASMSLWRGISSKLSKSQFRIVAGLSTGSDTIAWVR